MEDIDKEDFRKDSGDEGEELAAKIGPYGPRVDRRNEDEWLDETEPYHGARLKNDARTDTNDGC